MRVFKPRDIGWVAVLLLGLAALAAAAPEPASYGMFGAGLLSLSMLTLRRGRVR